MSQFKTTYGRGASVPSVFDRVQTEDIEVLKLNGALGIDEVAAALGKAGHVFQRLYAVAGLVDGLLYQKYLRRAGLITGAVPAAMPACGRSKRLGADSERILDLKGISRRPACTRANYEPDTSRTCGQEHEDSNRPADPRCPGGGIRPAPGRHTHVAPSF